MVLEIPEVVINRLPVYARALSELADQGETVVSSQALGEVLDVTPAQIRKDLSYFGRFGKQGRGYDVATLLPRLKEILGLNRQWNLCVIGVGRLGQAIVEYGGFEPQGFHILGAFDSSPKLAGTTVGSIAVRPLEELEQFLADNTVDIGVVAVPAPSTQSIVDRLVEAGVMAILNYTPVAPHVPTRVTLRNIDPVLAMQSMTYYIKK